MLDGQVVVIGDRNLEVAGRIVLHDGDRAREGLGGREGQSEWERIGDFARGAESRRGAIWIAERSTEVNAGGWIVHRRVGRRGDLGIGCKAGLAEVEEAGHAVLEEDAAAAANHRLAVAKHVIGKTDTGHELLVLVT